MTEADTERAEIARLRSLLTRANKAYYQDNEPIMFDSEFDRALARLKRLEESHPDLYDAASPTQRVGN